MKDLRKPRPIARIDPSLLTAGERQLRHEVELLQGWIAELEAHSDHNSQEQALSIYRDMLRSRKDMLAALAQQNLPQ